MSDIELPDLPPPHHHGGTYESAPFTFYTAEQMRAYAIADREKRAQAAQGWSHWEARIKQLMEGLGQPNSRSLYQAFSQLVNEMAQASKPVQACDHQYHYFGDQQKRRRCNLCSELEPVQAEAPSDDADPLTPEQEEWVMDLAEKHNLGRRMSGSTPRGLVPDVFYTDASYRTHELFCFAAELLAVRQAGQEPVASIYVSPNGEREFDDWGHDLPVGRNELCLATKQAEAPTASNAEPIARIEFRRGEAGMENEMPRVVSCNWLPDGIYEVYLATQPTASNEREAPRPGSLCAGRADCSYIDGTGRADCDMCNPNYHATKQAEAPRWLNVETAMADPLFQQARAIMGTENWFQDNALRNVINYVLANDPQMNAVRAELVQVRADFGAMIREDADCALASAMQAEQKVEIVTNDLPREIFETSAALEHARLYLMVPDVEAARNRFVQAVQSYALATQPTASNAGERERFEAWMQQKYPVVDLSHRVDGSYWSLVPDNFWEAWQARAALATQQEAQPQAVARWNWNTSSLEWLIPYRSEFHLKPLFFAAQAEPAGRDKEDAALLDWIEEVRRNQGALWVLPCGDEMTFTQVRTFGDVDKFPTVKGGVRDAIRAARAAQQATGERAEHPTPPTSGPAR